MMSAKTKLIINADDLGMSAEVNAQIEECIKLGVVTSSTLMANAPSFDEGVRIAKQYPQVSVGVHLNIIEFTPLTNGDIFKKHGIVGKDGNFIEGAIFCVPIDDELRQAVFEEWDAQISKVEMAGVTPTHCDSHEHTHTIKGLQVVLCRVLAKHNILRVRRKMIPSIRLMLFGNNSITVKYDKSKAMSTKKRNVIYRRFHLVAVKYYNWKWNRYMASEHTMTDCFYSFREFFLNNKLLYVNCRNKVVELMCHPGNAPFQQETDVLMRNKNFLVEKYDLVSYNNL